MATKVEALFKRMTGLNPRKDIEPPLNGQTLLHEIKRLRSKPDYSHFFAHIEIEEYQIVESGVEGQERYTLVMRRFKDGRNEVAFVFGCCLEPNEVVQTAELIPQENWFGYTEEKIH